MAEDPTKRVPTSDEAAGRGGGGTVGGLVDYPPSFGLSHHPIVESRTEDTGDTNGSGLIDDGEGRHSTTTTTTGTREALGLSVSIGRIWSTDDEDDEDEEDDADVTPRRKGDSILRNPVQDRMSSPPKANPPTPSSSTNDNNSPTHPQTPTATAPPAPTSRTPKSHSVTENYWESVLYIGACATLGSIIRCFCERFFGKDCEVGGVDDFLTVISDHICVTNGGLTEQTGGALFYDLPCNMIGCFIMGLITPSPAVVVVSGGNGADDADDIPHRPTRAVVARIPWLHEDHPIQRDDVYHTSLGTGLCGGLTTFASWNTQMVVMLDGSYTELGKYNQIVTVLFGYMLGLVSAMASFRFGRQVAWWMYLWKHFTLEQRQAMALGKHYATTEDKEEEQAILLLNINDNVEKVEGDERDLEQHLDRDVDGDVDNDDVENNDVEYINLEEGTTEFAVIDKDVNHQVLKSQEEVKEGKLNNDSSVTEVKQQPQKGNSDRSSSKHAHKLPLIFTAIALLVAFAIAGFRDDIDYYKNMTIAWFFAPIGAWIRWKLAVLNVRETDHSQSSRGWWWSRLIPHWIPLGTLIANLSAATIGLVATGLSSRYNITSSNEPWLNALIFSLTTGLSGSLSTVSTMIKETAVLAEQQQSSRTTTTTMTTTSRSYWYACGTCLVGMLWGLCVYVTTIHVGR